MRSFRALACPVGVGVSTLLLLLLARPAAAEMELRPCFLDGLAEEVFCGVLEVAEDAKHPDGRLIPIHFARVPALTRRVLPDPLVLLAGGPGQAARGLAPMLSAGFRELRRHREAVLVDPRGTGLSAPLRCPSSGDPLLLASRGGGLGMDAARCLAAQTADVRFYANSDVVDDLEAVRVALGFERWNLWGGSYGTRTALLYAQRYPTRVRSLVLDGAVSWATRFPLDLPRHADGALEALFRDCAAEPSCQSTFPRLRAELGELLARLGATPARVEVQHPRTGQPTTVEVSADLVATILRGALYLPDHARLLPHAIHQAVGGHFEPLLAMSAETAGWSVDTMALGATLSVLCSEDLARVGLEEGRRAAQGHILGRPEVEQWLELCRVWPAGALPDEAASSSPLSMPALVLSGGLDPVTPPEAGEAMRRHFESSWHLVAPRAGHNVSMTPCVPEVMAAFINRASGDGLDLDCARDLPRPPFFLPATETGAGGAR